MWCKLLVAERNTATLLVEIEDHDLDRLVELNNFRRMIDTSPREVGDMHKTINTAKIDEDTEVGDRLDDSFEDEPLLKPCKDLLALACKVLLKENFMRDDNVLVGVIDLHDTDIELAVDQSIEIAHRADIDL